MKSQSTSYFVKKRYFTFQLLLVNESKSYLLFPMLVSFLLLHNYESTAQIGTTCKEFIYLNSGNFNANSAKIHKFEVGSSGPFSEVIVNANAWYPGASGIDNSFNYPHGLGVDRNGFLYIGNAVFSPNAIRRFDCVGNLKPASEFEISNPGSLLTNIDSYDGFIYSNGEGNRIYKWDPCTGAAMGYVQLGDGSNDWGFSIDNKGKFYVTNALGRIFVFTPTASDFTSNTTYNPVIDLGANTSYGGLSPAYSGQGLQGITVDNVGNIYVVEGNRDGSGTPSRLLKFSPTFTFLAASPIDSDGGNGAGWNQMVGVVYSTTTNRLYTSSLNAAEDCLYSFDTNLNPLAAVVGPDPTGLGGKGLNILKECCPTSGTIDKSVCGVQIGQRISLSDLISTDGGVICDGQWSEVGTSSGLTFNQCDLTVTVTGNTACGTFKITNANTPNKTCADYEITLNVSLLPQVTAQVIAGDQTVCPNDNPASFTITTDAFTIPAGGAISYQWQSSTTSTSAGFTNILTGGTNATYDSGPVSQTTYFRVIASVSGCSSGNCRDTSNVVILTQDSNCVASGCPGNLMTNGSLENGTFSVTTLDGITTQMSTYGGSQAVYLPSNSGGTNGSGIMGLPMANFAANIGYWVDASTNGGSGAKDLNRLFAIPSGIGGNKCLWPSGGSGFVYTKGNCYKICFWVAQFDPTNPTSTTASTFNFEMYDHDGGVAKAATAANFSLTPTSTGDDYINFTLPASTNVKTTTGATFTGAAGQVVDWKTLNWQQICFDLTPLVNPGKLDIYISTDAGSNGLVIDGICATANCGNICTKPSAIALTKTAPTCTGTTANNNGKITLTSATGATNWGISSGATYAGPAYPASIYAANTEVQAAIPNAGGSYTLRLFNGAADCYKDTTITVAAVSCTATSLCPVPSGPAAVTCSATQMLATPCYVNGNPLAGGTAGTADAFIIYDYTNFGESTPPQKHLAGSQFGSVWGVAYNPTSTLIHTSAFLKRHMGFGPSGPGAIYKIDPKAASPSASLYVDLAALTVDVGTDPRVPTVGAVDNPNELPAAASDPSWDINAFDLVGKMSLGGIDFSDDGSKMYVMNLKNRELVVLNATASSATLDKKIAIPDPGCSNGEFRPWAVKYHQGKVYVGVVCSAETSQQTGDLHAYVMALDGNTFCNVFDFPLDYPRGIAGGANGQLIDPAEWQPWTSTLQSVSVSFANSGTVIYPQPILSDIEFDMDGSMILAFLDRNGHQTGTSNYAPNTTNTNLYFGQTAGDILRVGVVAGAYQLENNGQINGVQAEAPSCFGGMRSGANNNQGPGNGEYYWSDYYSFQPCDPSTGVHQEISFGSIAFLPGSGEITMTAMDPTGTANSGGIVWMNNTTGLRRTGSDPFNSVQHGYRLYDPSLAGNFGKAAGLGDIEVFCPTALPVCSIPTGINIAQTDATCTGSTANNNGKITLSSAIGATNWGISSGATYAGPVYPASIYAANTEVQAAIPNAGGSYTLRLFNGAADCYKDTTITVAAVSCTCTKPDAGIDQVLTCNGSTAPSTATLAPVTTGGTWSNQSGNPSTAVFLGNNVSAMAASGTYKFIYSKDGCTDTVKVIVPNCTPSVDPICFSSSRLLTDNKLGAVCTPAVTPEVYYSFYMILKNASGTHDRFRTTNLKFEEYCDGTAKIYGTVCSIADASLCLDIVYNLSGRTTTAPAGSPYAGFCNSSTTGYYYYTGGTGTITGKSGSGFNNLNVTIVPKGAAFQLGVGANTNENVFGAGGWVEPTIVNAGDGNWTIETVSSSGFVHGDFNFNLSAPTPLYKVIPVGATVCAGQSATLSANMSEKCTVTYNWTGPNGFTATGSSVTVNNATASGTYTVTAQITSASGATCQKDTTVQLVVNPKPNAGTDQSPTCVGGTAITTATLAATAVAGGTWTQLGTTPNTATITTPSSATSTVTGLIPGVYQFIWSTAASCSDTVKVTIPNCTSVCPTLIQPADTTVCAGKTITLRADLTGITTQDIKFVYFNTHQTDATVIYGTPDGVLGTVTNAQLTASKTKASLSVTIPASPASKTYHVYAILSPTPTDTNCRPYGHRHVITDPTKCPCSLPDCLSVTIRKK